MKGDFSRDSFEATKHFTRVLMQQGRVQLDADWNEQTAILLHYLQALATDLIGPHGGPYGNLGFKIGLKTDTLKQITDILIGQGRYYVDGILCESDRPLNYYKQDHYRAGDPNSSENKSLLTAPFLVYLDVWERHVTAIEDPDIREVALGGPDTASRAKVVWQVRVTGLADLKTTDCKGFEESQPWRDLKDRLQPRNRGQLKVKAQEASAAESTDPCITSPDSSYRGTENLLYRVEIHRGTRNTRNEPPTFKWSRDNGANIFPIISLDDTLVTLEHLGRDARLSLQVGDWVEVVDDDYTLAGSAEPLLKVLEVDHTAMTVTLEKPPTSTVGQDSSLHPLLRRWDQKRGDPRMGGLDLGSDNAALIFEGTGEKGWHTLEDGIQIQFQTGATYRSGDYWLIPARTATGDVIWPRAANHQPLAQAPHGPEHHYAPLAAVFTKATLIGKDLDIVDLRHGFSPLGKCWPGRKVAAYKLTDGVDPFFKLFVDELRKDPDAQGYIIGYSAGDAPGQAKAQERVQVARDILSAAPHSLPPSRLTTLTRVAPAGDARGTDLVVELWLAPPDAVPPA
jgi:hypothetical protein